MSDRIIIDMPKGSEGVVVDKNEFVNLREDAIARKMEVASWYNKELRLTYLRISYDDMHELYLCNEKLE